MNAPPAYRQLQPGEPAPWIRQHGSTTPSVSYNTVVGRYVLMCFFGSVAQAAGQRALRFVAQHRSMFDDERLSFFGVSIDPDDEAQKRVIAALPGIRLLWDFDRRVSRAYGALPAQELPPDQEAFRPLWAVLSPNLQVRAVLPFARDGAELAPLLELLQQLPPLARWGGMEMQAPVILLPDIFEPELCRTLIAAYDRESREISGFMREKDGMTVLVNDTSHKVRRDHLVEDEALQAVIQQRIRRSVVPAIARVHQFEATRIERYLVGCYDAGDGGHFRPHRDNTTKGTAHRRFALSINLNDGYEGGDLNFPEFGPRRYKPPAGAGVVFSCSLVHAVDPVRKGRRYAFLPFLFDDKAAQVREANLAFIEKT